MSQSKQTSAATVNDQTRRSAAGNQQVDSLNPQEAFKLLLNLASTLSKDEAFKTAFDSIEKLPALEIDLKKKEEQVVDAQRGRQQALQDYNDDRDKWKAEKQQMEESIKALQQKLSSNENEMRSLRDAEATWNSKVQVLHETNMKHTQDKEIHQKEKQGLVKAIEAERQKSAELKRNLEAREAQIAQMEGQATILQSEYVKARKEADWNVKKLEAAAKLTVPLQDDVSMDKVDNIWQKASSMIYTTFASDADVNEVKRFWRDLRQTNDWCKWMPMPESNSEAAKHMRCVAIMSSLGRTFADYLFQPTYHLPESSGIRDVMLRQAQADSEKEAAFRALLLALLPHEQEDAADRRIGIACNKFMADVGRLLPNDKREPLRKELEALADEACEAWQDVCCFIDAVEPSFQTDIPNQPWDSLAFGVDGPTFHEQASISWDQVLCTVFPRLYSIDDDARTVETRGTVFMWSEARAAQEEVRSEPPSPRHKRRDSVRSNGPVRSPPAAAGSIGAKSDRRSFLGPVSGEERETSSGG